MRRLSGTLISQSRRMLQTVNQNLRLNAAACTERSRRGRTTSKKIRGARASPAPAGSPGEREPNQRQPSGSCPSPVFMVMEKNSKIQQKRALNYSQTRSKVEETRSQGYVIPPSLALEEHTVIFFLIYLICFWIELYWNRCPKRTGWRGR